MPNHPIHTIVQVALFKDHPQDLPSSTYWVILTAIAALLAAAFMEVAFSGDQAILRATLQIAVYGLVVWIILRIKSHQGRWKQTVTALFGAYSFVQLLSFLPQWFINSVWQETENTVFWMAVMSIPFGMWNLFIIAYVLKEALEMTSKFKSFLLALGLSFIVSIIVLQVYLYVFEDSFSLPQ